MNFLLSACSNQDFKESNESNTVFQNDEDPSESLNDNQQDVLASKLWDEFRFGIVNNEPDFDMLKHYNPDQISTDVAFQLIDDEYTKELLKNTTFDALEDEIFDGESAKAFYVIVASDDIMVGTIYYFLFGSNGLQLIGTMPY
jgi:hypothetical protein